MAPYLNNHSTRWRRLNSFVVPTALILTQRGTILWETRGYHSGIAQDPSLLRYYAVSPTSQRVTLFLDSLTLKTKAIPR